MHIFPNKKLTLWDGVLLGILALVTAAMLIAGLFSDSGASFTVSTPEGTSSYSLAYDREYIISSGGINLTVTVSEKRVSVTASDCPDHTCQHSGAISRAGEAIVCVPAEIVIRIVPDAAKEHGGQNEDFIIG